jgi:hypothetical protein
VTLVDPDAATFARRDTLTRPPSALNPADELPTLHAADTTIPPLPTIDCPAFPLTLVSDIHPVCSDIVPSTLTPTEYDPTPICDPCTVTLAAPVAA